MSWQYYHTVWLVMSCGWIAIYLVRMSLAPLLEMIMSEFHISYAMAGAVFSALFYSYGLMQFPSGYLGDRFGRRKILIIGTLSWFFLSLATSLVWNIATLVLIRFLTGMAHGIYFGNDRPTIMAFTPEGKAAQGQGVSFMGLGLGLFLSVFLAGMIADHFQSWRPVFTIFSIPSLITCLMVHRYIREPKRPASNGKSLNVMQAYREALTDRNLWLIYVLGFVLLFAYWVIITWMPSIYGEIGVQGVTSRSLLSGILGLIGMPGLFLSGILSDRMARQGYGRKGFMALMTLVWALLMLLIGFAVDNRASSTLVTILFLSSGLVVFGIWSPYYTLIGEMASKESVGTTFGLANFIGFLGAWIAPALTGWIKDCTGSFSVGLYLSGVLLVVGTLITLAIHPVNRPERGRGQG